MERSWRADKPLPSALSPLVRTTPVYFLMVVALAAVVAWGVFVYVSQQLSTGLGVTGMNTPSYWGLYISNFVFFIGLLSLIHI